MDLVKLLSSQLGISEEQAKGGTGLLLKLAKDKLGSGDFQKVAGAIPGAENMISSAPDAGGGLMGMIGSAIGGQAGDLAKLASGFDKLGLSPDMIQKFVPVILEFLKQGGGEEAANALQEAVKK